MTAIPTENPNFGFSTNNPRSIAFPREIGDAVVVKSISKEAELESKSTKEPPPTDSDSVSSVPAGITIQMTSFLGDILTN